MNLFTQENLFLRKINIRELSYFPKTPCDLHSTKSPQKIIIRKDSSINVDLIKGLVDKQTFEFFYQRKDHQKISHKALETFLETSRRFSSGSREQNFKRVIYLFTNHQQHLYKNPFDSDVLLNHLKMLKILSKVIFQNKNILNNFFRDFKKLKFDYLQAQPINSSFFLFLFLNELDIFDHKYNEELFFTSILKDIGMSLVDKNTLNKSELSEREKKMIDKHGQFSKKILSSTQFFSPSQLKIIEHHHDFKNHHNLAYGLEILLISASDIICAMMSDRPFRKANTLYQSLDLVKHLFPKSHLLEFKALVNFSPKFFKK